MTKQLEKIAYHEGGHAVAHVVLGLPFEMVTIIPTDDFEGRVEGQRTEEIQNKWEDGDREDLAVRDWMERELIALCAGPIAQRRQFPRSQTNGTRMVGGKRYSVPGSDQSQIVRHCYDLFQGEQEVANAYERFVDARARSLVEHYWPEIETLARALLERPTMTEFEVRKLLCPPGMEGFLAPGKIDAPQDRPLN